jgi:hypothetical protein
MLSASRVDLSQAFCSYCGYPPMGPWRSRAHRVCMRCQLGIVLRATPNQQPHIDDPFLIVNQALLVQAISHRAEDVLRVKEPDAVGGSVADLLCVPGRHDGTVAMAAMVDQAIAGEPTPAKLEVRTVRKPAVRLVGRLARCGPPPAALLILSARDPKLRRSAPAWPPGALDRRTAVPAAWGDRV